MNDKHPLRSKTLWANVLGAAVTMLNPGGVLGHVLGPAEVGALFGVGNVLLRFVTDKKLVW